MATRSSNLGRGFAVMPESKRRTMVKKGSHSQNKDTHPGNFANGHRKTRRAAAGGDSK